MSYQSWGTEGKQSLGIHHAIDERIGALAEEARKKFNDAIYRRKHNTDVTAEDVWGLLRNAQESPNPEDAWKCAGFVRELERRGQIEQVLYR